MIFVTREPYGWAGGMALRSSVCLQNELTNFASLRYAEPADFCFAKDSGARSPKHEPRKKKVHDLLFSWLGLMDMFQEGFTLDSSKSHRQINYSIQEH